MYAPRSSKLLLSFISFLSKTVENGIALTSLKSTINKPCYHLAQRSFCEKVFRLRNAGYPVSALQPVCQRRVKQLKGTALGKPNLDESEKVAVIPYMHALSHRLKKTAERFGLS